MNVERAKKYTKIMMKQHGLDEWRTLFTPQFISSLGVCDKRKKLLVFSSLYVQHNPFWEIKDLILHEIAHALDTRDCYNGHQSHDEVWEKIAISIGCNGSVSGDATKYWLPEPRYQGKCWRCDKVFKDWTKCYKKYCFNCYDLYCDDFDLDKDGNKKLKNYRIRMNRIINVK